MPNIPVINIGGTDYNVKDAFARNSCGAMIDLYKKHDTEAYGGITWSYDSANYALKAVGTNSVSGNSHNIIVENFSLGGLKAGKYYNFLAKRQDLNTNNAGCRVQVYINYNNQSASWSKLTDIQIDQFTQFKIPDSAIGLLMRFNLDDNSGPWNSLLSLECTPEDVFTASMLSNILGTKIQRIYGGDDATRFFGGTSCNDVDESCFLLVSSSGGVTTLTDWAFPGDPGWLATYCTTIGKVQFAIDWSRQSIAFRTSKFTTWNDWSLIGGTNGVLSSCDLDSILSGNNFYLLTDSNTYQNTPINQKTGFLQVLQSTTWVKQIYYALRDSRIWIRTFSYGTKETNWELVSGSSGNTYNITQNINRDNISNTYDVPVSPTITTDANGWLQAVDNESTSEANATDMTAAIMAMLNSTGHCHLSPGVFYVSGNIDMPDGSMLEGCGEKTVIRLLSSVSSGYIVRMKVRNTIKNIKFSGGKSVGNDFFTDGTNYGSRHGIYFIGNADGEEASQPSVEVCMVHGCWFEYFLGSGFYTHNSGGGLNQGIIMNDCYFTYCKVGINIDYFSEYAKFTNCIIHRSYWACINNGGNQVFTACTFHGVIGMLFDNSADDKRNNTHGSVVGCTFNHIDNMNHPELAGNGIAVKMLSANTGEIFTGCQFWYGNIDIDGSSAQFSDCLFGNNGINIKVTGNVPVFFMNNIFFNQPTLNVNSQSKFVDNFTKAGAVVSST